MGPFKKYATWLMAFFITFNFVTLCQFYFTASLVLFAKLHWETTEWEKRKFFPYMAASAYPAISTEEENHIFKQLNS